MLRSSGATVADRGIAGYKGWHSLRQAQCTAYGVNVAVRGISGYKGWHSYGVDL